MNKRMRELLGQIEDKTNKARQAMDEGRREDAAALLDEAEALGADYAVEARIFDAEQRGVPDEGDAGAQDKKPNGFVAMVKRLRSPGTLTEAENALISGDNAASGENFLVPEDVRLAIIELRRQYKEAKALVTVIPTSALTGTFNFESGDAAPGLVNFTDGDEIDATGQPKFVQKGFKIALLGKLLPISNILKGLEKAGLMAYLKTWFVRNAVVSENSKIFAVLKAGKTAKALTDWKALKKSINTDLDPAMLLDGVIVTNQDGFNILDEAEDANGRPILQENPANRTEKLFQGLRVEVFSNAELPNVAGKSPIFYGSLKSGCYFIDLLGYQFAVSEHIFFNKNQTAMRVIEGFDVIQADKDAYIYATIAPPAAP